MSKLYEWFIHFVSCVPLTTYHFQPLAGMGYNSMLSTGHLLEEAKKSNGWEFLITWRLFEVGLFFLGPKTEFLFVQMTPQIQSK